MSSTGSSSVRRLLIVGLIASAAIGLAVAFLVIGQGEMPHPTQSAESRREAPTLPTSCTEEVDIRLQGITSVDWSPDATAIAVSQLVSANPGFRGATSRVVVLRAPSWVAEQLADGTRPRWSGTGNLIAVDVPASSSIGETKVVDARTAAVLTTLQPAGGTARWHGDQLLYVRGDEIRAWARDGDRTLGTLQWRLGDADYVAFSADGTLIATARFDQALGRDVDYTISSIDGGTRERLTDAVDLVWSPSGHELLVAYGDRWELRRMDGTRLVRPRAPGSEAAIWVGSSGAVAFITTGTHDLNTLTFMDAPVWGGEVRSTSVRLPKLSPVEARMARFSPDLHMFAVPIDTGWGGFRPLLVLSCR